VGNPLRNSGILSKKRRAATLMRGCCPVNGTLVVLRFESANFTTYPHGCQCRAIYGTACNQKPLSLKVERTAS